MGLSIADIVAFTDGFEAAGIWTRRPEAVTSALLPNDAYVGDSLESLLAQSDVLVDFSLPAATRRVCDAAVEAGVPLVCGVSGLGAEEQSALETASRHVAVVYDRNMSRGVTVLNRLVADAARALGPEFEVRIDETHHAHKQDAPSGTALKLGEAVAAARERELAEIMHYSPDAPETEPEPGQVHFHVEREGEVPGDHAVEFRSEFERLTLSHSVTTRDVFARGAVAAARWVVSRPSGLYSMENVLFGADGA